MKTLYKTRVVKCLSLRPIGEQTGERPMLGHRTEQTNQDYASSFHNKTGSMMSHMDRIRMNRIHASLTDAHKHCIRHRDEILASDLCGCFYCIKTFTPDEITNFLDEREGPNLTAQCPHCGIDSVIGSASGIEITDDFLRAMHTRWFRTRRMR